MLGNIAGDTNRIQVLMNDTKSKTIQFMKIVWQFFWLEKPENIFCQENLFYVDAHTFIRMLTDTLIRLPQLPNFENMI